jgi:hypothetical protein
MNGNKPQDAKSRILSHLKHSSDSIGLAWTSGVQENALAAELPAFQRMKEIEKELGQLMLTITKLRGI